METSRPRSRANIEEAQVPSPNGEGLVPLPRAWTRPVVRDVRPQVDCGRRPAKTTVGENLAVEADAFIDGHESLWCELRYRSIGNVPLASVLWNGGISFGGVISFIFADLIILPILLIYRKYYGTKMMLFILATFYVTIVLAGYVPCGFYGILLEQPSLGRTICPRASRWTPNRCEEPRCSTLRVPSWPPQLRLTIDSRH